LGGRKTDLEKKMRERDPISPKASPHERATIHCLELEKNQTQAEEGRRGSHSEKRSYKKKRETRVIEIAIGELRTE